LSSSPDCVGFGERFLAFLIDTMLVWILLTPLFAALYGSEYLELQMRGEAAGSRLDAIANVGLAVLTIVLWRFWGATPGKMAIPAKIVDARTGEAASAVRLVVRFFAYIVSIIPFFLGFVWIAIDRRKQAWHDKIAGTLVIYDDD
jgi:uncharacterized RDD family membrane protein YckC